MSKNTNRHNKVFLGIAAVLMAAVITLMAIPVFASEEDDIPKVPMGETVPDFTVETVDGSTFNLQDTLKEKKAVLINFFGVSCPFCIEEFPLFNDLSEKYNDQVAFIALDPNIGFDMKEDIEELQEEFDIQIPLALEEGMILSDFIPYVGTPCTVVIDSEGKLVLYQDYAFDDEKILEEAFKEILSDDYKGGYSFINQFEDLVAALDEAEVTEDTATVENGYKIVIKDQNGDPVPNVFINFCSEVQQTCRMGTTDEKGEVFYEVPDEKYHIQIISVPEGYTFDQALEIYTENMYQAPICITIKKK